jgi:hypothetical protein
LSKLQHPFTILKKIQLSVNQDQREASQFDGLALRTLQLAPCLMLSNQGVLGKKARYLLFLPISNNVLGKLEVQANAIRQEKQI